MYMYMMYEYSSTLVHIQQYSTQSTVLYIYCTGTYTDVILSLRMYMHTAVFYCIDTVYKYRLYTVQQWYSTYGTRVICDTLTKKF